MRGPIWNQLRSAVEWSLTPLILVFGGILPNIIDPYFHYSQFGRAYGIAMGIIAVVSTCLLCCTIVLERIMVPDRPEERKGALVRFFGIVEWFLTPAVSLAFGAIPAIEAQTRLITNQRIAYVESRKE
jgi:hypothetical protein